MAKSDDPYAVANRIRVATESLTSSSDKAVVAEYLRELHNIAREQEEEITRPSEKLDVVPLSRNRLRGFLSEASAGAGEPKILTLRVLSPDE